MSDITLKDAIECLKGVLGYFRELLPEIKKLDEYKLRLFILALGTYLYGKYYISGNAVRGSSDKYTITAQTMTLVFPTDELSAIATKVVSVRNWVAHKPCNTETVKLLNDLTDNKMLYELLKYEKILDDELNFIEPDTDEYKPLSVKLDYREEKRKLKESKKDSDKSFIDAIAKMSGKD